MGNLQPIHRGEWAKARTASPERKRCSRHAPRAVLRQRHTECAYYQKRCGMMALPPKQGLYDPWYEHDACGIGFVADLKARPSHDIVAKALRVLLNLGHRGACGCEANTGDGAGILMQVPHRFLFQECDRLNISLPPRGQYGVGMVYLPTDAGDRRQCETIFEQI